MRRFTPNFFSSQSSRRLFSLHQENTVNKILRNRDYSLFDKIEKNTILLGLSHPENFARLEAASLSYETQARTRKLTDQEQIEWRTLQKLLQEHQEGYQSSSSSHTH